MIFVAWSASASSAASRSELMRSECPSGPNPMGETIGTTLASISSLMKSLSMRSTLPVNCWSTPLMMPTGRARTALVMRALQRCSASAPRRVRWDDAGGGADGEIERGGVGHAGAVGVGDGDVAHARTAPRAAGRCRARARP